MCACFQWLFHHPHSSTDEDDPGLEEIDVNFTSSYPTPSSATAAVLSPRSLQRVERENRKVLQDKIKVQERLRYRVEKISKRTGGKLERWLEVKLDKSTGDPRSIILRKRREGEGSSVDVDEVGTLRTSQISNLRCKWGEDDGRRLVRVEFSDRTCSPLLIFPLESESGERILLDSSTPPPSSNYDIKDHPTMKESDYLEDLMTLLTGYHYRKPEPDSHPSVGVISTLRGTIQDGLFTAMQNHGDRLSSDGTIWELTRHEMDGSRVFKSQSLSPNIPRIKVRTHIQRDIDSVWEYVSNWVVRPLYDDELYRANIIRQVEMEGGGGDLQVVYYKYKSNGRSVFRNREFLEARLIVPPTKEGKRVGRVITFPIRSDSIVDYASSIPGHGIGSCKSLKGTHHECAWFITEFGSKGWCRVEIIVKVQLEGNLFDSNVGSYYLDLLDNVKRALSMDSGTAGRASPEAEITVAAADSRIPPPFPLKRALTLSNSVLGFSARVVKGIPGLGFGMEVTITDGGLMEVTHVSKSIQILPFMVNGKVINHGYDIMEGDVIVEVENVSTVGRDTSFLIEKMKTCKIGDSVTLGLERLGDRPSN